MREKEGQVEDERVKRRREEGLGVKSVRGEDEYDRDSRV